MVIRSTVWTIESMFETHDFRDCHTHQIICLYSDSSCICLGMFSLFLPVCFCRTLTTLVSWMGTLQSQSVFQLVNGFFDSCMTSYLISYLQSCGKLGLHTMALKNRAYCNEFPSPLSHVVDHNMACRIKSAMISGLKLWYLLDLQVAKVW